MTVEVVQEIGLRAKTQPLYSNLVIWTTYVNYKYARKGNGQTVTTFQFTGETKSLFDRYEFNNEIASSQNICEGEISLYDASTGAMTMV